MAIQMIVDATRRQFKATDAALVAWKPKDAELSACASYVEDAIVLFQDRPAILRRVVERLWQAAQSGSSQNLLQLWHDGSNLFRSAMQPVTTQRELIALLMHAGFMVHGVDDFERTVHELEEMGTEFRRKFPAATPAEAAAEQAAIVRGEVQDVDEAFAEIAGVDIETWRQRIARSTSVSKS